MSVGGTPVSSEGENPYTPMRLVNPEVVQINRYPAAVPACDGSLGGDAVVAQIPRTH